MYLLAQTVHAGTEHGALDLDHILIAVDDGIYDDGVAILDPEVYQLELLDVVDALQVVALAEHPQQLLVGIARKAAAIF